jgi:prepilin-type N-terminal cleavage/methylation domain-containing protein/prepilin-type processing-associated H-X9-DG protein
VARGQRRGGQRRGGQRRGGQGETAFTLIELLMVIAIIAILAALLLTGLTRAKSAADSVACKSNLRQLTLAMTAYTQQNGTYPFYLNWPAELQPFVGSPWPEQNVLFDSSGNNPSYLGPRSSVWACPAYNHLHGAFTRLEDRDFGVVVAYGRGAYCYNTAGVGMLEGSGWGFDAPNTPSLGLGGAVGSPSLSHPTRENQVLSPSDMVALSDAPFDDQMVGLPNTALGGLLYLHSALNMGAPAYGEAVSGVPPSDPAVKANRQRHAGRWNVGFCDGHVESLRTIDLFNMSNSIVSMRWNNDHQSHIPPGFIPGAVF